MRQPDENDRKRNGTFNPDAFEDAERVETEGAPETRIQRPPRLNLDAALEPEIAAACREIAAWIQIAAEVVVTCLLAHASAAIGNTRWVVARGFRVPLSLHYVTSLPSGSGKSEVRRYLQRVRAAIVRAITAQRAKARKLNDDYEQELADWRKTKKEHRGQKPTAPEKAPLGGQRVTYAFSEANIEGLIDTLDDSPRGSLWTSDEAHEVIGMLGAYGEGRRSLDAARLRKLMDSQPVEAHRSRSNASPMRLLPRPWLALDLDVQPRVLDSLFSAEDAVSGLTARLLLHEPPAMQGTRNYLAPPLPPGEDVLDLLSGRLNALWDLKLKLDEDGTALYEALPLDHEAERLWAEELQRIEGLYRSAGDEVYGSLGHARGRLLRLAGVLALLRQPYASAVGAVDMGRAIVHMRYHLAHEECLLGRKDRAAAGTPEERERQELVDLIRARGGSITPRELMRASRRYRDSAEKAEAALDDLESAGYGRWEFASPTPEGGRPSRRFTLAETHDDGDGDRTPAGDPANLGSVTVTASPEPNNARESAAEPQPEAHNGAPAEPVEGEPELAGGWEDWVEANGEVVL